MLFKAIASCWGLKTDRVHLGHLRRPSARLHEAVRVQATENIVLDRGRSVGYPVQEDTIGYFSST